MGEDGGAESLRLFIERLYREESRRVLATLIRLVGDIDLAEDSMHDAFASALAKWRLEGAPTNPRAWLVSAGRFKAIDSLRRRSRFNASLRELADRLEGQARARQGETEALFDDRLRLIFLCCHPALSLEAQVALTLRETCGLRTEEIARAFLVDGSTLAQRIVRAKAKIRDARIPYEVPTRREMSGRLDAVLRVIYLVYNEGYFASAGDALSREELSAEAIRLGRLLSELLPEGEVFGLLGLMLLNESRRCARSDADGDLILLDEQDRSLWSRELIAEGSSLAKRALASQDPGPYSIQAAIAAVHAEAQSAAATDWRRIAAYYDRLADKDPSPVVALNRAVAFAMRDGPSVGLELIDGILERGDLEGYHLAHAARADLCRRLGMNAEARRSYERALELAQQGPERRFLERRLLDLTVERHPAPALKGLKEE
jgi:RNA polymerase sigma-70 factor (ECF subfamily)